MCRVWFYSIFIFALTMVTCSDSVLNKCPPGVSFCTLTLENTSPHKFKLCHHDRQRFAPRVDRQIQSYKGHGFFHLRPFQHFNRSDSVLNKCPPGVSFCSLNLENTSLHKFKLCHHNRQRFAPRVDGRIHSYKVHGFFHHRPFKHFNHPTYHHPNPSPYHNFNHRPHHYFHHRHCTHPWSNQWTKPSTVTTSIPSPVTETTPQTTITNTPPYIPNVTAGKPDLTTTEETLTSTVTEPAIICSTQYKPSHSTRDIIMIETTDSIEIENKDNESTTVQTETNKVTKVKVDSTENGILATTKDTNTEEPTTEDTNTEEPTTDDTNTKEPTTEDTNTKEPITEDTNTIDSTTEGTNTEGPSTEDTNTKEPTTEDTNTEQSTTKDTNTEEPTTEVLRTDPLFEELSTNVRKMCDKVRLYCNNKTSHMFSDYTYTINIPLEDYEVEDFEIKTQHRVLSIVGVNREKTEEYSELIILERAVNPEMAVWSYKDNKLEIFFSIRETDNSCESFIDNSVRQIPKEFIPIPY